MAAPNIGDLYPLGRCTLPLLNLPIVCILVGTLLGFLAGLGVGGGSLLILWLTFILQIPQSEARVLNLLFFLPCALISCVFRWRQGALQIKKMWGAIVCGAIAAAIFSLLSYHVDTDLLKKLFGGLLLLTGFRELTYRAKNAK